MKTYGVPEELAIAVRQAADTVPPPTGDIGRVLQRHRARRRRRRATATATAATATLAAAAVAVATLNVPSGAEPTPLPRPAASMATPAQRLLLNGAGFTLRDGKAGREVDIAAMPGVGEVLPDGSVTSHPVPGVDDWYQIAGLPNGGLVVLGYKHPAPAAGRVPGVVLPLKLEVLRPDGTIQIARDLAEPVVLLGATEREAYLLRRDNLVSQNLATGRERTVLAEVAPRWNPDAGLLDVGGGRFVGLVEERRYPCWLQVTDLTSRHRTRQKVPGCELPGTIRLSPNGRLVAVSYHAGTASRVAIVDTTTGAVQADHRVSEENDRLVVKPSVMGLAWTDDNTLRVATMDVPEKPIRVYRVDEILRVETISTGPPAATPYPSPSK